MIWQQDRLLYYNDFTSNPPNYEELTKSHRILNCEGISRTITTLVKQFHPDETTQFKNYKTREYQFNLF
jgi:hypothetical protein